MILLTETQKVLATGVTVILVLQGTTVQILTQPPMVHSVIPATIVLSTHNYRPSVSQVCTRFSHFMLSYPVLSCLTLSYLVSPGYYCNMSKTQTRCPPGFYCPVMSEYPRPCPVGHYCPVVYENGEPRGAIEPIKCPLGYKMYDGSPQGYFNDTCEPCWAGFYGNHIDRLECLPCRAGVVCQERATTDQPLTNDSIPFGYNQTRSYPCPAGKRKSTSDIEFGIMTK